MDSEPTEPPKSTPAWSTSSSLASETSFGTLARIRLEVVFPTTSNTLLHCLPTEDNQVNSTQLFSTRSHQRQRHSSTTTTKTRQTTPTLSQPDKVHPPIECRSAWEGLRGMVNNHLDTMTRSYHNSLILFTKLSLLTSG